MPGAEAASSAVSLWADGEEAVVAEAGARGFLKRLLRQKTAIPGLFLVLVVAFGGLFADASWITLGTNDRLLLARKHYAEANITADTVNQGPSLDAPLGTDQLGRDVFSRVLYGGRVSLAVAVVAALIAGAIGIPLGVLAGFVGGWLDELIVMRLVDMMMAFPTIVLLLVLAFAMGPSMSTAMIVIGVVYSPGYARLARAVVLTTKEEPFVLAARSLGAAPGRVVGVHILPSLLAPMLVGISLSMAGAIIFEASLSFLGLGIQPPTPAWGSMLRDGYVFVESNPVAAIAPGLTIMAVVVGFSFLGDAIRDASDPTLRGRG